MPNLKFNQLLVISNSERSANQFIFEDHLNLITATDNSVGKSTLSKLMFWALGCDPTLDKTWENLDCKVLLKFSIGKNSYKIIRYKNSITLRENDKAIEEFVKITGDYSKRLAEIVGFKALIANRSTQADILETPPPAYYFTAFYIDQLKSWSKAWDNFESLSQYQNWRSTIIQYHVGLLTPEHFLFEENIAEKKNELRVANSYLDRINTTLEVVSSYVPSFISTLDDSVFLDMTSEIEVDLNRLSAEQEVILNKLSVQESDKAFLENQRLISEKLVHELEADYNFTIQNIDDEIVCPLCGVVHDNSLLNRASILTDKQQAEAQLEDIETSISELNRKIIAAKKELEKIRSKIGQINTKYGLENNNKTVELKNYIDAFAVSSVRRKVEKDRINTAADAKLINDAIKRLKKDQKDLVNEEHNELINQTFLNTLQSYIKLLNAEAINLSNVNSPTDYNRIVKEGGAAEGTRGVLAYYLAVYSTIERFGSEVATSMVIDTPNQQEQSIKNYDAIVDLISNKMPSDTQIILCAMDNMQLKPFKDRANVIFLDNNKILDRSEEKFLLVVSEFEKF